MENLTGVLGLLCFLQDLRLGENPEMMASTQGVRVCVCVCACVYCPERILMQYVPSHIVLEFFILEKYVIFNIL